MHISRCVLRKDGAEIILQGMTHMAPANFFLRLKEELDEKQKEGYQVFYEQVTQNTEFPEDLSAKEEGMLDLMFEIARFSFDMPKDKKYDGIKFECRENILKYPEDAINADLSLLEIIRLMAEKDIDYEYMLNAISSDEWRGRVYGVIAKMFSDMDLDAEMKKSKTNDERLMDNFRKLESVFIDNCNEAAVDMIEKFINDRGQRKNLVYYGEKHIPGISDLLMQNGWKLEDSSKLNLAEFGNLEKPIQEL